MGIETSRCCKFQKDNANVTFNTNRNENIIKGNSNMYTF